ncbi:hypothetical protein Aperf_G00000002489 [Anoplocephala perfoliata]
MCRPERSSSNHCVEEKRKNVPVGKTENEYRNTAAKGTNDSPTEVKINVTYSGDFNSDSEKGKVNMTKKAEYQTSKVTRIISKSMKTTTKGTQNRRKNSRRKMEQVGIVNVSAITDVKKKAGKATIESAAKKETKDDDQSKGPFMRAIGMISETMEDVKAATVIEDIACVNKTEYKDDSADQNNVTTVKLVSRDVSNDSISMADLNKYDHSKETFVNPVDMKTSLNKEAKIANDASITTANDDIHVKSEEGIINQTNPVSSGSIVIIEDVNYVKYALHDKPMMNLVDTGVDKLERAEGETAENVLLHEEAGIKINVELGNIQSLKVQVDVQELSVEENNIGNDGEDGASPKSPICKNENSGRLMNQEDPSLEGTIFTVNLEEAFSSNGIVTNQLQKLDLEDRNKDKSGPEADIRGQVEESTDEMADKEGIMEETNSTNTDAVVFEDNISRNPVPTIINAADIEFDTIEEVKIQSEDKVSAEVISLEAGTEGIEIQARDQCYKVDNDVDLPTEKDSKNSSECLRPNLREPEMNRANVAETKAEPIEKNSAKEGLDIQEGAETEELKTSNAGEIELTVGAEGHDMTLESAQKDGNPSLYRKSSRPDEGDDLGKSFADTNQEQHITPKIKIISHKPGEAVEVSGMVDSTNLVGCEPSNSPTSTLIFTSTQTDSYQDNRLQAVEEDLDSGPFRKEIAGQISSDDASDKIVVVTESVASIDKIFSKGPEERGKSSTSRGQIDSSPKQSRLAVSLNEFLRLIRFLIRIFCLDCLKRLVKFSEDMST